LFVLRLIMPLVTLVFVLLTVLHLTDQQHYVCDTTARCGCSKSMIAQARIIGGAPVKTRSWSWMVSLTNYFTHGHFCGGTILSESWILTAAHCVSKWSAADIIINAGSNNLDESTVKRHVAKIISHPNYDPNDEFFRNDIALIKLSSPLDLLDVDIARICVPQEQGKMIYLSL
jgi:secreted trypsin-like serine protease